GARSAGLGRRGAFALQCHIRPHQKTCGLCLRQGAGILDRRSEDRRRPRLRAGAKSHGPGALRRLGRNADLPAAAGLRTGGEGALSQAVGPAFFRGGGARRGHAASLAPVSSPDSPDEPRSRPARWGTPLAALLIVAAGFLAYRGTFHAPYELDDHLAIADNPTIRDLHQIGRVLSPDTLNMVGRPVLN